MAPLLPGLLQVDRTEAAVTEPVRLRLSRAKGFDLQAASRAVNSLPARSVARPHLFGNIFKVGEHATAADAVTSFRRFLLVWPDTKIVNATRFEDGSMALMDGLGLLVLRNRIRANLWHLKGRNLACYCQEGSPCHADIYLDIMRSDLPDRWKAKYPAICNEVRS